MSAQPTLDRATGTRCHGCGAPLPPSRGGRARKWCSERCRKAQYAGTCERCGGPTDGTCPGRGVATVCAACRHWSDEEIIDAIRRWADEHGEPPTCQDWRRADVPPHHPAAALVCEHIGWNEALLRAGYALRKDRRPETQTWIEDQLRAGVPTREIADALGVIPQTIHNRLSYRGKSVKGLRANG